MYNSKVSISFKFLCLTGDTFTDVFLFQLLVFEVQTYEGLSVYVSVRDTNSLNHLGINGLFAEKLKLKDKQQVSIMKLYNLSSGSLEYHIDKIANLETKYTKGMLYYMC